jgi:hypothetical protein
LSAFDVVAKHVVPHTDVIASPSDDARPSDPAEKSTGRSAPSRARHPPSDDPGEGPQESLEGVAAASANEQVQVVPHVCKIVDPDSKPMRHRSKRIAHGALVAAKRPRATSPVARENDVHRAADADRPLELATVAPDGAAVLGAHELGVHVSRKKGPLHLN